MLIFNLCLQLILKQCRKSVSNKKNSWISYWTANSLSPYSVYLIKRKISKLEKKNLAKQNQKFFNAKSQGIDNSKPKCTKMPDFGLKSQFSLEILLFDPHRSWASVDYEIQIQRTQKIRATLLTVVIPDKHWLQQYQSISWRTASKNTEVLFAVCIDLPWNWLFCRLKENMFWTFVPASHFDIYVRTNGWTVSVIICVY